MTDFEIWYPKLTMTQVEAVLSELPHELTAGGVWAKVTRLLSDEDADPPMFGLRIYGLPARCLVGVERALQELAILQ